MPETRTVPHYERERAELNFKDLLDLASSI